MFFFLFVILLFFFCILPLPPVPLPILSPGLSTSLSWHHVHQGGSMPNTSSSVPFLLSSSMQSIRSRRTSTCLSSGPLNSGSGLLQQLGSGMVRQLTSTSGTASPVHHQYNGNTLVSHSNNTSTTNLSNAGPGPVTRGSYVRKCPSLNITFSTHWLSVILRTRSSWKQQPLTLPRERMNT